MTDQPARVTRVNCDQPSRVTPGEISALLDQATRLTRDGGSVADQLAYHERKASLLSRIAAGLDTAEAHEVAAQAWHYLATLARRADSMPGSEVPR